MQEKYASFDPHVNNGAYFMTAYGHRLSWLVATFLNSPPYAKSSMNIGQFHFHL